MERTKVQRLYDACNAVFCAHQQAGEAGRYLPSFRQIHSLKNLLNTIEAVDVGIDEYGGGSPSPSSSPDSSKELIRAQAIDKITYIHIHECDNFSIGMFCFPAGGTFPLHDHPGMTVLSKLLYGSMYVKAYDWVKFDTSNYRTIGLAGKVMDGVMETPCEPSVLFPRSGGNIHAFTALTPCAILDVLSPPYSDELDRPSTYFLDYPIPSLPGYAVLEERDVPEELVVAGAPYLGPPIVTKEDPCFLQDYRP
ncbi:plant cysteine oxidase 1-like isoform X2 [Punica granatum]|uniref:cysteine dioxygenase n=1 Tax=Punica granatum TaxID=22663 RepID=A0A6P8DDA0_PUNGR|nr:plant cysteine oxidase 1-like isoform X2 [Punica granatum]